MKEILEDLFKERTIDSGALGREIIFENEFNDMIDEIVKLCNLRIVSQGSELLNNFSDWYDSLSDHERDEFSTVSALEHYLFKII
jgi:hypothetical protein